MLDAIVSGEDSAERLADLALGKLRSKIPQLRLALEGCIRDHHRFLLDSLLRQFRFLEAEIKSLDLRLEQLGEQHKELADAVARWITVPGVERVAAWAFVAEIGPDMAQFPSAAHLASWAGVCPGNHESAGKRLSGKSRKGSPWLRAWPVKRHGQLQEPRTLISQLSSRDSLHVEGVNAPLSPWHTVYWSLVIICRPTTAKPPPRRRTQATSCEAIGKPRAHRYPTTSYRLVPIFEGGLWDQRDYCP